MNIPATTALVPVQRSIRSLTPLDSVGVNLQYYKNNHQDQVVYIVYPLEESDGVYGPNGRKLVNPTGTHFIDIYV